MVKINLNCKQTHCTKKSGEAPAIWQSRHFVYIDSSGGGGHKAVADALGAKHVSRTRRFDIMMGTVKKIGQIAVNKWNQAKRSGNVQRQANLLKKQWLANYFLYLPVFFIVLKLLILKRPLKVVNTQAMGLSAITNAIRFYNFFVSKKKKCSLDIYLTDMPTSKASHFFKPIKSLNSGQKSLIRLHSPKPLLKKGQTEQAFWKHHCGLNLNHIKYIGNVDNPYPVRHAFSSVDTNVYAPGQKTDIEFKINDPSGEEKTYLSRILGSNIEIDGDRFILKLDKSDHLTSVVIGSQSSQQAIERYIETFIQTVRLKSAAKNYYLTIFCGNHKKGKNDVFKLISEKINSYNLPSHIKIIPFSFQNERTIAQLNYRANLPVNGAGGSSAYENLVVNGRASKRVTRLLHSEAPGSDMLAKLLTFGPKIGNIKRINQNDLKKFYQEMIAIKSENADKTDFEIAEMFLIKNENRVAKSGIALWELGNAQYLKKYANCEIVTEHSFSRYLQKSISDSEFELKSKDLELIASCPLSETSDLVLNLSDEVFSLQKLNDNQNDLSEFDQINQYFKELKKKLETERKILKMNCKII